MKRVLIVSYCFPPVNIIGAKRFGTMCKYLEQNGYKPYVLTTRPGGYWGTDIAMDLDLPIGRQQIIRIGSNSSNGIIHSFWGKCLINLLDKCRYVSRTVSAVSLGWYELVRKDLDLEQLRDIDIIIGTYPLMENLFVAYYLSRRLKCPYIADIRDLISDYSEVPKGYKRIKWVDSIVERFILGRAGGIVTVTPGFKRLLRRRYPDKLFKVVFNGWDKASLQTAFSCENNKKYLYYAGSLYPHRLESFQLLMRCIYRVNVEKKENIKLVIRPIGPKWLNAELKQQVKQNKMQKYVVILESANEQVVWEEQEKAYINVTLSTIHEDDVALMTTVPGKIYELLNRKAPVLAIVPSHSDVGKILDYTNKGIASVSEEQITEFILGECEQYKGNKKINYFTRKRQAIRLCQFMDHILEK